MPTATEQALIDAYGDPTGIISQSIGDMLMNPYGGMVDVRAGQEPSPTGQLTPWGGPLSVTLPGTHPIYSNVGINDVRDLPLGFGELERQRNLVDILVAGGDLKAPSDYSAPVDVYGAGRLPGHYIDSDTYGYQAGLKAALAKQVNPLGGTLYGLKQFLARQPENITDAQWELIKEAKSSAAEEAIDAYDAAQLRSVGDTYLENISPSVQDQIDRDEAEGLFDVGERSMASNVTFKPGQTLTGSELNKWLRQGGVLQANTPSGIPGQPSEFRGITGADVPSRTRQAINTVRKVLPSVARAVPTASAVAAGLAGGYAGLEALGGPTPVPDYVDPKEIPAYIGRQRAIDAARALDPEREAAATMGYLKPEEFGLDPFTNEQIAEARATFQRLMEETPEEVSQYISPTADPYIYQDQVAEALQKARAEQTLFTGDEVDVASRAPLNMANIMRAINRNAPSTGIGTDIVEPTVDPSPFIGDPGFTPSLGGHTLGGSVVGTTQTGVPSGFEALASLIQDDPSVAQKYISGAGPTAELANLVANTGVETFTDIPETPWTPPAPVVPDITEELVDFSAIQSSREAEAQKAQDKIDRQLEHAANVRRKDEEKARLASARNAKSEQARINKENKERKAEEKRIADSQAAAEKKRRATEKQMADMLKQMNETHQAYLARKREEEARRKRLGYGVGAMWT